MPVGGAGAGVLVLVGLPGAGKSTVGPLVAARLGWRFVDLDQEIERSEARPVAEIFARDGEPAFRALEHEATQKLTGVAGLVLAPGGGWMLARRNLEVFEERAVTVYLRVSPAIAIDRLRAEVSTRPLLAGPDPLGALRGLLDAREAIYLQADHVLAVDSMAPDQVADTIVALATGSVAD
jgi:shikimate kinase